MVGAPTGRAGRWYFIGAKRAPLGLCCTAYPHHPGLRKAYALGYHRYVLRTQRDRAHVQPTPDNPWPRPWPESARIPPLPALPLTEPLRARLRQIRERQMAEHLAGHPQLVCAVFYDEEVVCLIAGGGHAAYLGTDGRIHTENYGEGLEAGVLTDPRDVASTVVRWADAIEMPELIDLLPARPEGAVVCRLCEGRRWEVAESSQWCCRLCRGLGWTLA